MVAQARGQSELHRHPRRHRPRRPRGGRHAGLPLRGDAAIGRRQRARGFHRPGQSAHERSWLSLPCRADRRHPVARVRRQGGGPGSKARSALLALAHELVARLAVQALAVGLFRAFHRFRGTRLGGGFGRRSRSGGRGAAGARAPAFGRKRGPKRPGSKQWRWSESISWSGFHICGSGGGERRAPRHHASAVAIVCLLQKYGSAASGAQRVPPCQRRVERTGQGFGKIAGEGAPALFAPGGDADQGRRPGSPPRRSRARKPPPSISTGRSG